jgi:hypothetical protein
MGQIILGQPITDADRAAMAANYAREQRKREREKAERAKIEAEPLYWNLRDAYLADATLMDAIAYDGQEADLKALDAAIENADISAAQAARQRMFERAADAFAKAELDYMERNRGEDGEPPARVYAGQKPWPFGAAA